MCCWCCSLLSTGARRRQNDASLALFAVGATIAVGGGASLAGLRGRIAAGGWSRRFETGAKYALAVGAAAATVGMVIGVVTLTGVGFKISYIITDAAPGDGAARRRWCRPALATTRR